MDFFNNWTLNESEIYSLTDLSCPIPSDPTPKAWSWPDQSTARGKIPGNYSTFSRDGGGSSNTSRKSSQASVADSPVGENVVYATNDEDYDLDTEDQGQPLMIEKEPTCHRIQRRRIQNRNAQRNFRQRQENERRMLEEQLRAAEQQCTKLNKTCTELDSVVNIMRERLKRLEAENTVLRTSVYSMPWRKDSA